VPVLRDPNLAKELAGPCAMNGETLIPKNILHIFSEGKMRKSKTYELV
jgi:hypothetical protein